MARVVLIHGSWFGAWCWEKTAALLRGEGHRVVADDLPGHGGDRTPVAACTLETYVARVCAAVESSPGPVVLVGHSMGGIVISEVAERLPGRVGRLVYLAGYLLQDGESILSIHESAPETGSLVRQNMVPSADWSTAGVRPEGVRATFLGDADQGTVDRAIALLRPEPTAPFGVPIRVTAERFGSVPRTYLHTTADRALTPALQNAMLAATPCQRVVEIDSSHCPMLSAPERLAMLLNDVIR